jgi:hypothetical protein
MTSVPPNIPRLPVTSNPQEIGFETGETNEGNDQTFRSIKDRSVIEYAFYCLIS